MYLQFRFHSLRRDLSNFALLRHRDYTGFLVSMHQSGTHWLKHMLATALAQRHGLPPPAQADANDIIGGTRTPRRIAGVPTIVSSHSVPHPLLRSALLRRLLPLPPYVVLVRDPRAVLVANYEKWKTHYACDFAEYLRGDPAGRRFNADLWSAIRFLRAWHAIAERFPQRTLVLRYEDLVRDAAAELGRVSEFLALGLERDGIAHAVAASSKERLAQKADPSLPPGVNVVRADDRHWSAWYAAADREFVARVTTALLPPRVFGYTPGEWPAADSSA